MELVRLPASSHPTRVDMIVATLARRVEDGTLRAGERIGSIRLAAAEHGVSKNTLAEAYDRLVASGHLEARAGSGFFVRTGAAGRVSQARPHLAEALDLVSLLREQLDQHYEVRPGDGRPPSSWMDGTALGARFDRLAGRSGPALEHGYGSSRGFAPLRESIAAALNGRSIRCSPDQVLMTSGANHALDLVMRLLLEPGDTALVDDPGYYPLFGKLRLGQVRVVGIRRLPNGPDLSQLEEVLRTERPKVFFTQSLAHNPTGGSLSLATAHGMLRLAERHGFHIVEDDPFADLLPAGTPRLAALDSLDRVLSVGTFSKTLSASLRVGYVAAGPALTAALADLKLLTTVATSDHAERLVHGLIAGGHYLRHLRRLRTRLDAAIARSVAELRGLGLAISAPADRGFYLWLELPSGIDEERLCRRAAERSIFLAPGAVFRPTRRPETPAALRVNVAHASHPRFLRFLREQL